MKKKLQNISSPDELDKRLQYTSPFTWITLSLVLAIIVGFFVWSFTYKIKEKVTGKALINGGEVSLNVSEKNKSRIKAGQKVFISNQEGEILSYENDKIVVSTFTALSDGEYEYTVLIKEIRPIDFLLNK